MFLNSKSKGIWIQTKGDLDTFLKETLLKQIMHTMYTIAENVTKPF